MDPRWHRNPGSPPDRNLLWEAFLGKPEWEEFQDSVDHGVLCFTGSLFQNPRVASEQVALALCCAMWSQCPPSPALPSFLPSSSNAQLTPLDTNFRFAPKNWQRKENTYLLTLSPFHLDGYTDWANLIQSAKSNVLQNTKLFEHWHNS